MEGVKPSVWVQMSCFFTLTIHFLKREKGIRKPKLTLEGHTFIPTLLKYSKISRILFSESLLDTFISNIFSSGKALFWGIKLTFENDQCQSQRHYKMTKGYF